MSEFRRKLLMNTTKEPHGEYIQNGLIFELDGLDKCQSENYVWVDKVGGIKYSNIGSVIELPNGFYFPGDINSGLIGDAELPYTFDHQYCTLECVIYPSIPNNAWGPIFSSGDWDSHSRKNCLTATIANNLNNNSRVKLSTRALDGQLLGYSCNCNVFATYSLFVNDYPYINKIKNQLIYDGDKWATANVRTSKIGYRVAAGNNKKFFTGNIYAIRIYNRILTEEEIFHNQNIDIQKYNIPI
jgi:hypothetical protein